MLILHSITCTFMPVAARGIKNPRCLSMTLKEKNIIRQIILISQHIMRSNCTKRDQ